MSVNDEEANVNSEKLKEYYDELRMVFSNALDTLADKVSEQAELGDSLTDVIHNIVYEAETKFNEKYLELAENNEADIQIINIAKEEATKDAKESMKSAVKAIFTKE